VDIAPKRIPVRRRYQYLCQFTTERRLLLSDYLSRRGVLRGVRSIEALVFEDVVLPPSLTSMLLPPMPPFQMPCFTDVSCCCTTAQKQEATSAKPGVTVADLQATKTRMPLAARTWAKRRGQAIPSEEFEVNIQCAREWGLLTSSDSSLLCPWNGRKLQVVLEVLFSERQFTLLRVLPTRR
jgi:hypothetical protein